MNKMKKPACWIFAGLVVCGAGVLYFKGGFIRTGALVILVAAFLMGILGTVILGNRASKLGKERHLQEKAWKDLTFSLAGLVIGGISLFRIIRNAEKIEFLMDFNVRVLILFLVISTGIWVTAGPFIRKKHILKGLDERERRIYEKAKAFSDSVYSGISLVVFLGLPVWFGLKTSVPIYVPVCLFFLIAFVAEIIRPVIILVQYKLEQTKADSE